MKHLAPLGRLAVAVLACVAADGTWALSIGRAQGAPLVGRPLEVSVPVQFDPGTDASSHCAAVEVFYGDNRLAADRVTTDLQTGATTSTLRVRTLAPVDEPVVTLYLHIGCQGRLTRRVVLLADHPDPLAEPLPRAVATPGLTPVLPLPPAAARRLEPGGTGPAAGGSARSAAPSAPGRSAVALARPAPVAPAREAAALARGRTADRLRLDASDRAASGAAVLRLSTDMGRPADGGGQQRALAAAIWRALNATPEELLRDTQRLQALEGEL
ncbi:MAG TPA: hypothetical protein VEA40_21865, partial [Ramlibacter sp.]|nr:hypothetical protein [Ramlibacter sp.]